MSNSRKLPRKTPEAVAAVAAAARCSDCPGRAVAKFRDGSWVTTLRHVPTCPAYLGTTRGLHADAEAAVDRAAVKLGQKLGYRAEGREGFVLNNGSVTTGRAW